jgi:hypothetical protein
MTRIRTLFLLLTIVGPLHMTEQMLTSIDEFYAIRTLFGHYYALFDPAAADIASVMLITIVWTFVSVLFYLLLREGTARLVILGVFGVFGITEVHHAIESLMKAAYDPGVITCVPYAVVGYLLTAAVARELLGRRQPLATAQRSLA